MRWNAKTAVRKYTPSGQTDVDRQQFAARLSVCEGCTLRVRNRCRASGMIVSTLARRAQSRCPEYLWPGEQRPAVTEPIDDRRQLKCLMFTGSLGLGGAEQWIRILTNESRHIWKVLCFPGHSSPIITDQMTAPIISWNTEEKNIIAQRTQEAAYQVATDDIDCVVCWGGTAKIPLPISRPAVAVSQGMVEITQAASGDPTVGVVHGCCDWTKQNLRDSVRSRCCSHYVAVSEAVAEICPSGTSVILNGIDADRLTHSKRRAARERFGLPVDGKIAAYVGRLSPDKNCEVLAAAIGKLPENWTAFFCGDGAGRDEAVAKIEASAGKRAVIHPAVSDVGNAYIAADVVVSASPSEGCSLAAIEAWYLGVPVVSTRVGAIPEIERDVGPVVVPLPIDPLPQDVALGILLAKKGPVTRRAKYWARLHGTSDVMVRNWDNYLNSICRPAA